MATYKEIKGVTVQTRDEDPVEYVGSWSSAANVNQARASVGSAGTQSANLMFGGPAPGGHGAKTELWNGSSWTEVNDLNTPRHSAAGMGTSTAAVYCAGRITPSASTAASENWDGTSWTEGNDINRSRYGVGNKGAGTQTAGLIAGGNQRFSPVPSPNYFAGTEEYDGTSWTEVNDLPSGLESGGGIGTQTAAGLWGGYSGSYTNAGQLYDGTNWTSTTAMPITGGAYGSSGTTTDGILFGFFIGPSSTSTGNTVSWDGTAFTEQNDLSTARYNSAFPKGSGDPSHVAIMAAGYTGTANVANTEEWNFPPDTAITLNEGDIFLSGGTTLKGFGKAAGIPAGTFASGGSLNSAASASGRGGSQTAAIKAGGFGPGGRIDDTELYNGSTWTEVNDLNNARGEVGGDGTQTAALVVSGEDTANTATVEEWDGSSWTEITDVNTARRRGIGTGGVTGFVFSGGYSTNYTGDTETWNGSSWTEVSNLNTSRDSLGGGGINGTGSSDTSSFVFGGATPSVTANSESWDGSSWTEVNNLNSARRNVGGFGSVSLALSAAGGPPAGTNVEAWNGTSWSEISEVATARFALAGAGSAALGLIFGGSEPSKSSATEEFTADATLSTVTVS